MAKDRSIAPADEAPGSGLDGRSGTWLFDPADPTVRQLPTRIVSPRVGLSLWLAVLLVFSSTFVLRAVNLGSTWEIYVDEVTYLRLSERVAEHLQVWLYGNPFLLHPPAFFFLEAAYLKIVQPEGHVIQVIHVVRYLNVTAAAASAVLLFLIARTVAGWPGGLLAAGIFTLDPFVIRMNSRNLIEPTAMLWILVGYTLLLPAVQDGGRPPLWRQLAVGVAFGLALLSKDMMAFLSLVPLGLSFLLNWSLPRLVSFRIGMVTVLTYLPYPLIVFLSGDWQAFEEQKLRGLLRMIGTIKETGFKRPGGPSLVDSVLANLSQFATTYSLIALGALAIVVLMHHRRASTRLIALWTLSAYGLLGYSVVLGTLEEQFFYLLMVPAIVATSVAGVLLWQQPGLQGMARKAFTLIAFTLAILFTVWSVGIWFHIHTVEDNGYERVVQYLDENVSHQDPIAVTNDTAQFLLPGYILGFWTSVDELRANQAKYAIVNMKFISSGYNQVSPDLIDWIVSNGRIEYVYRGRDGSEIVLYRLTNR